MSWEYGDPIILGSTELEVGGDDYDKWAELAKIIGGENDEEDADDRQGR